MNDQNALVFLEKYMKGALKVRVEQEFDILKTQLLKNLEEKKNEICVGILLEVMAMKEVENAMNRIVFTIREIK